ncbi:hypothetical protein BGZ63DRAFT_490464 [Mariannaea sp. PMI_226]|nr:hypothetical protein BGZ63DRAFT_490464 [Mariannaea sp. PMI_226]
MRLKRGIERASCSFCFRRKMKCDRLSRAEKGHNDCSHCALRMLDCNLDDCDDIRVLRRRITRSQSAAVNTTVHVDQGQQEQQRPLHDTLIETNTGATFHSPVHVDPRLLIPGQNLDVLSLDSSFELSSSSLQFLDQIFMTDDDLDFSSNMSHEAASQFDAPVSIRDEEGVGRHQQPWVSCNLDQTTFMTALQAYFNYAALCLPILYEDAFWLDFQAGRCAPALVYAVACCGIPFLAVPSKWDVQQRLAQLFKDAFFETCPEIDSQQPIRLDHLEALALMVNFEYEGVRGSSMHSHLESLFLKHDTLVLLTLQSRIQDGEASDSNSSVTLARASERRFLLFWHVYGLDAFHNLDRKSISRIQDSDVDVANAITHHEAGSYLDTILGLSFIARRIGQAFGSRTVRRTGIEPNEILLLFGQLEHWRSNSCPSHLRRQRDTAAPVLPGANDSSTSTNQSGNQVQLHRAAVWLLDINCCMQIESYVTQYGFRNGSTLEAEMVALRVEHEALRAVHDAVEVAQWNSRSKTKGFGGGYHSLADLAPTIVRNAFAGTCFWTCVRGQELLERNVPSPMGLPRPIPGDASSLKQQRISDYLRVAETLRDAVVTAVSHKDTRQGVERVDEQLSAFKEQTAKSIGNLS